MVPFQGHNDHLLFTSLAPNTELLIDEFLQRLIQLFFGCAAWLAGS